MVKPIFYELTTDFLLLCELALKVAPLTGKHFDNVFLFIESDTARLFLEERIVGHERVVNGAGKRNLILGSELIVEL